MHKIYVIFIILILFVSCTGKYIGQYHSGKKHGSGTYTYPNGDTYFGEWKNGKRNRQGTLTTSEDEKYSGEWKDDQKHGQGKYIYIDGRVFTGQWVQDKSTHGTCIYPNGDKYQGNWINRKRHGQGTFTCGKKTKWSGNKYIGQWKDDKMHGQGTYIFNNGSRYTGEWKNNNKNGMGTMKYSNGDKYSGLWKDDIRHGAGVYYYADGRKYAGIWIRDVRYGKNTDAEFTFNEESREIMRRDLYLRSIIPGWGQFYSGNRTKGYIYSGTFAVSGGLFVWSLFNQKAKRKEYDDCTTDSEFNGKWSNYEKATYTVWGMAGLLTTVYILHWVDIFYFNKQPSYMKKDLSSFNDIDGKTNIGFNFFSNSSANNPKGLYISFNIKM